MKKKLIPFILGLSMAAALPLTARADDLPEQDSGNVTYGSFADVNTAEEGTTDVVTAIPECTITIPRDTTIKRGAKTAKIGKLTVNGQYFVKPYYIEVKADRNNFVLVDQESETVPKALVIDPKANQDIVFDVATTRNEAGTSDPADDEPSVSTENDAAYETTFVKSGRININGEKETTYTDGVKYACRRFWKDDTIQTVADRDKAYRAGEVSNIKGQEDIWLRVGTTQWTGVLGSEADTKPVGGQYKGSITFTATFRDDFDDTYDETDPNMHEWETYVKPQP